MTSWAYKWEVIGKNKFQKLWKNNKRKSIFPSYRVIVASSLEIMREMFKENVFSGRTDMHIMASKQHAKLGTAVTIEFN